jgi:hypothetical protein
MPPLEAFRDAESYYATLARLMEASGPRDPGPAVACRVEGIDKVQF